MLFSRFSPEADDAITFARDHAKAMGHPVAGTPHLLCGIMHAGTAYNYLTRNFSVRLQQLTDITKNIDMRQVSARDGLTREAERAIKEGQEHFRKSKHSGKFVMTTDLLAGLMKVNDPRLQVLLRDVGLNADTVLRSLKD